MRYIPVLFFVFLFVGCKKNDPGNCAVVCGHNGATAVFEGYTIEEVDTIYLRSYKRDGLFDSMYTETLVSKPDSINFPGTPLKCLAPIRIDANIDYEIFIPSTAQTFRIEPTYDTKIDTFPCNRSRTCEVFWESATVTGGDNDEYRQDAYNAYIVLKK